MWSLSTLAAILVVLVPLDAFPSSEFTRPYPFDQNYDCGPNGGCETGRYRRAEGMVDDLTQANPFGLSKRPEPIRGKNREESLEKRRVAALDSLVAGGMFGKAAKRSEYEYDTRMNLDKFQRNVRPLNTMELGASFGRAIKRFSLDTLGNNAFGVEKRRPEENVDEDLKAYMSKHSGNYYNPRADSYRYYLKSAPDYNNGPKFDQLLQ